MAVQIPDPGQGDNRTGDNEYVFRKKVQNNFSDQSNAASREVGTDKGNVTEVGAFGFGGNSLIRIGAHSTGEGVVNELEILGTQVSRTESGNPLTHTFAPILYLQSGDSFMGLSMLRNNTGRLRIFSGFSGNKAVVKAFDVYTTGNTTIEEGTNYLKVASPILRLQHNSFEKEHEAEKMDIAVENPSVGVYEITGTTGLRDDGTWYFSPPKDEHNNVLCMVEVSEQDGVVTVNTYKKKFDFETVSIVADYEQPTDIPEGAIVMLRFNDLPQDEV